jgi:hypothetical protein
MAKHLRKALIIISLFYVLLALILGGCGSKSTSTLQTNVQTYSNTKFGFFLNYPDGWRVEEDVFPALGYVISFEKYGEVGVTIAVSEPTAESSYSSSEDFYNRKVMVYLAYKESFEIIEQSDTVIDGLPARQATFTYEIPTDQVLKHSVVAFLDTRHNTPFPDSNSFMITFEMPIDTYESYYQDFRIIVDSFKFTESP